MKDIRTLSFNLPEDFFKVKESLCKSFKLDPDNQIEINYLFSENNIFFNNGEAFIEIVDDKARIALFISPEMHSENGPYAYFGFFECINDQDLCAKLIKKCKAFLKERNISKLIGPINFNTYHQYRIASKNNNEKSLFFNEPKNPNYYQEILQECGFEVLNEYLSYIIKDKEKISKWYKTYKDKAVLKELDQKYTYIPITPEQWLNNLKEIHLKSELIFGSNFAYTPISFDLFRLKYGNSFSKLICPKTSILVKDNKNEIIGAMINFPNHYSDNSKKTLLLKTMGILPEYSEMGAQIINMLRHTIPKALKEYDDYIVCLMQNGNYPSILGRSFMDTEKKYSLLQMDLTK